MDKYGSWEDVPDHLKTKSALNKLGLKLKRGQMPAAIKTHWDHSIPTYNLYNINECIPKVVTDAQRAAAAKAQAASLAARTCTRCKSVQELSRHYRGKLYVSSGLCDRCREDDSHGADRQEAVEWARALLQRPDHDQIIILDTETVDLFAEVIELAIITFAGSTLYQSRFRNTEPVTPDAQRVHRIADADLLTAPPFSGEYQRIKTIIEAAPALVIYNAGFDVACLNHTCKLYDLQPFKFPQLEDLFGWNNIYANDWSHYWQDYRWQSLGGNHTALGDCQAVLELIHEMAEE